MVLTIAQIVMGMIFMYFFWRGLRDNYHDYKLVEFSWMVLLGFLLGARIFYVVVWGNGWRNQLLNWLDVWQYPGMNLLGGYGGVFLMSVLMSKMNNWKLWPLLEDVVLVAMPFWAVVNLFLEGNRAINSKWIVSGIIVTVWLIITWFKGRYRSLSWYPSGKKGFLWFWSNIWLFGLLLILSFLTKAGWPWMGLEIFLGLISGVGLFMLGKS